MLYTNALGLPNHRNNDVADGEGCDPVPDVRRNCFFLAVDECKNQDDENKSELHADLCVIDQRPFHGVLGVKGVADCNEGEAGNEGGKGGVKEAGCDLGTGAK
jgi:hypothetical protein